jgi:hypothetical protein
MHTSDSDPAGTRPIHVVIPRSGRHLFEGIRDDRVALGSDAAQPSRLIVLPCGQDRRFEELRRFVWPEPLGRRVAEGRVGVALDASPEAVPPKPDIVASLHDVIAYLGASPRQCVYLTANWYFAADYRAYCQSAGVDSPVPVIQHDYWIWNSVARFADAGEQAFAARLAAFRGRSRTRARRFVSLNRTPRPFKIALLLRLLRDGLWERGFVSFGGFAEAGKPGKAKPTADQLAAALPGFEDMVAELAPMLDVLESHGCVLLGLQGRSGGRLTQAQATEALDLAEYDESWFSAVTETEMHARPSRITEKVLKPLVNFHPLIVFGNPGSLQRVRDYGFATFGDLIDESYDEEPEPRRRFELAYSELLRLSRMTEAELADLESRAAERLIHNARWGLTQFPSEYRARRDTALVNEILSATDLPLTHR